MWISFRLLKKKTFLNEFFIYWLKTDFTLSFETLFIVISFYVTFISFSAEHRHSKRVKRQFQFPNFGFQNFPQPNFPQQNFPQFNFPGQSSGNLFNQPSNNLNNRFGDDPIKDQQNFFSNNGFGSSKYLMKMKFMRFNKIFTF